MIHIGYILYSPHSSYSNSFCGVYTDGSAITSNASNARGIAP